MSFNIEQIIRKIQANIICPVCKRHFHPKEIKLRGILEDIIIFHVQCAKNHLPIQTIHIALIQSGNNQKKSFDKNQLKTLHKQIDNFDGDFYKLWKK